MTESAPEQPNTGQKAKLSIKDVLQSVFAAALGVQSAKNRERDFQGGSAGVYIAAGLIFTALFIGGVIAIVQLVVPSH